MSDTIRKYLDACDFDWTTGRVFVAGRKKHGGYYTTDDEAQPMRPATDEDLDYSFYGGFGGNECPAYIAYDNVAVYFSLEYDGATSGVRALLDPARYIDGTESVPC